MDDITPNRHYPLPHPDNPLSEDVVRLRETITRIDADMAQQAAATFESSAALAGRVHRSQLRAFHQFNF